MMRCRGKREPCKLIVDERQVGGLVAMNSIWKLESTLGLRGSKNSLLE